MKQIIESTDKYDLIKYEGVTRFKGCQCYKDCNCSDNFIPEKYKYYTVRKKVNRMKTTMHTTLEEAKERILFINTIPVNRIIKS